MTNSSPYILEIGGLIYLIFAFALGGLDIREWGKFFRMVFAVILISVAGAIAIYAPGAIL